MKKVYFLRVYKKDDDHTTDYGDFFDSKEAVKLGVLALRAGVFKSLKEKERMQQAIEGWNKFENVAVKDGRMEVCEKYVYDILEEYLWK